MTRLLEKNLLNLSIVDNPLDSNRQYLRLNLLNSLLEKSLITMKRQKESIKFLKFLSVYHKADQINSKNICQ